MSNKVDKITKSATALVVFALIGKFMGFARETLIANYFGAQVETDAFVAALKSTNLITAIVSNAIANTFIPMLSKVRADEGEGQVAYHTNNMLIMSVVVSILLTVLGIFAAPLIVGFVGKGFDAETFNLTLQLTKIGMPVMIFSAIVGVMTGYLQSQGRFGATGAIPIPLNVVYIFYLIVLSDQFGVVGLTIASVLAILAQALFLLPETIKAGHKYFFAFNLRDKYVIHALELSMPVLLSVAINDINIAINTSFASGLEEGTVSWLNFANKLNVLILGIFIAAITSIVFPIMSKAFSEKDIDGGRQSMALATRLIFLITIPATVGLMVLARPIVEIAFQRGKFTAYDAEMTAQALIFYAPALTALSLNTLLNRVYYSLQDTITPLIISAIAVSLNVFLNFLLVKFLGHRGLALALTLGTNISVFISFMGLRKKLGHIYGWSYLRAVIKDLISALLMGLVTYFSFFGLISLLPVLGSRLIYKLLVLLFSVFLSVITYGALTYFLGVGEVKMAVDMIKSKRKH
ncbi:MAG: murein biosynthesis integral membrane protein MurJ [Bacillota bacterium]|nr:murein biosynthesis integral membrane protein MurJ [Bacillota bacterium]